MKKTILAAVFLGLLGGVAVAGYMTSYACKTPDCGFMAEVHGGTGRAVTLVNGYCIPCGKMVTRSIPNKDLKDNRPVPIGQAWDSATGRTLDLYECPACGKPFAEARDILFCPKCGKQGISGGKITGKWD